MALTAADMKFFQSELEGSSGGALSTLEIPQDQMCFMFPYVTRGQAKYGAVQYKKVFAINMSPDQELFVSRLWLLMQPSAGIKIAIGIGSPTDTDGEAITYSAPISKETAIYLGDLIAGSIIPIWIRRVIPAGTPDFERGFFQLALTGKALLGV
jgi:hypothetical protein